MESGWTKAGPRDVPGLRVLAGPAERREGRRGGEEDSPKGKGEMIRKGLANGSPLMDGRWVG